MYASKGRHIVTSLVEHKAVLDTCKHLEKEGCEVTYLKPERSGRVSLESVAAALRDDTILVALIWANNEIGTLNPIREIGALCHEKGVLLFADASRTDRGPLAATRSGTRSRTGSGRVRASRVA